MEMDPMEFNAGDVNLYRAYSNSPTINLDPLGLKGKIYVFAVEGAGTWFGSPTELQEKYSIGKLISATIKSFGVAVKYEWYHHDGNFLETDIKKAIKAGKNDCSAIMVIGYSWGGNRVLSAVKNVSTKMNYEFPLVFTIDPVTGTFWGAFDLNWNAYRADQYAAVWRNWYEQVDTRSAGIGITGEPIGGATNIPVKMVYFAAGVDTNHAHTAILSHKPMLNDLEFWVAVLALLQSRLGK